MIGIFLRLGTAYGKHSGYSSICGRFLHPLGGYKARSLAFFNPADFALLAAIGTFMLGTNFCTMHFEEHLPIGKGIEDLTGVVDSTYACLDGRRVVCFGVR